MASSKLTWQAYDRVEQHHTPDWYFAVSIIALAITVTAILLHNLLFAVLVVISTIVLFLRTLQKPRLVHYELTKRGLWTNKEFQAFTTFDSFWVSELGESKLMLKSKALVAPLLIIDLGEADPDTVRSFLEEYLPEVEHQEPLSKKIMEYLGF